MKWLLYTFLIFFTFDALSQEGENIIENTVSNTESEFENEDIIEDLLLLSSKPININDTTANYDILLNYGLIQPIQIEQLKVYIRNYGDLITLKELLAVPQFTKLEIDELAPYISVISKEKDNSNFIQQFQRSRSTLILREQLVLEDQDGFLQRDSLPPKFAGGKSKIYLKFRKQFEDKLSIGIVGDKDAGEDFFSGNNKTGFDFYSAHIAYKPKSKIVKQITLGDYEVKVGQGLVQWNGFSLGKGADATTVFLKGQTLRPYTSSNEINFLRGLATTIQLNKNINTTLWFSTKNIDANKIENTSTISSIQTTGLHRTEGEIADKKSSNESIIGTTIQYENDWLKVGLLGQFTKLKDSLVYRNQDYQTFYNQTDQYLHTSLNYTALKGRTYLFGETAMNQNGNFATINGLQYFFQSGVKSSLVYRNYAKGYQSYYASSLSENTNINNEEGLYLGLSYSPIAKLSLETYVDLFHFPWKKFRVSAPSNGSEFFFQGTYQANRKTTVEFRSKLEEKQINITGTNAPTNELTFQKRYSNRIELRYKPDSQWYLKSRIGHSFFETSQKKENGYLLFQDVVYELANKNTKFYSRIALFNTPSFDSRVYAYENDLLYNFSVPAYYGKGTRYYAMASHSPINRLKLWVKFSQTIFSDREEISSGNTEISGNTRSDLKMQIQWRF